MIYYFPKDKILFIFSFLYLLFAKMNFSKSEFKLKKKKLINKY